VLSDTYAWHRRHYGVPAMIGGRVVSRGRPGTIVYHAHPGSHVFVLLDGEKLARPYHPTDLEYTDPVPPLRVLSLTQPWATLMILGEKSWETRGVRKGLAGPTGIAASANYPKWARELARTEPFVSVLRRHGLLPDTLPTGVVLGKAWAHQTVCVESVRDSLEAQERAFGDYSDRRFCTLFSDPVPFPKPIPAKGALCLWPLTEGPMPESDDPVWYAAQCCRCDFRASSEYFGEDNNQCGDGDVFCPLCGSTDVSELEVSTC
jgi:hypothetical protein